MTIALLLGLLLQMSRKKYVPITYWLVVVLTSITGTLLTDNLTDNLGISLILSSAVFAVLLALSFIAWYQTEKSLSIHSIDTFRREAFYWLTILLTFALGTATGDLVAEKFAVGYGNSFWIFVAAIAVVGVGIRFGAIGSIFGFWATYVLTRPLGASIGDFMSQSKKDGGIALGTTTTSFIFLAVILTVVTFLTITKKDVIRR